MLNLLEKTCELTMENKRALGHLKHYLMPVTSDAQQSLSKLAEDFEQLNALCLKLNDMTFRKSVVISPSIFYYNSSVELSLS